MAKTGLDVLYDMIQKTNGSYAVAEYASNNIEGGLSNINVVSVDEVSDKPRLCRSLYSKILYGLMGIQSLIPSLGKNTLIDVDTVLQSLDVSELTVFDNESRQTLKVNTYLRTKGLGVGSNPWVQMLKNNNINKNGDLGRATAFVKDGKNCVRVNISNTTKNLSKAVAKVLAENSNLTLPTITNFKVDFDSIEEFISTTLPEYMENYLLSMFPNLQSAKWTFPSGLAQAIIDNHLEYMHVGVSCYTDRMTDLTHSVRGEYWLPWVVFSEYEVNKPVNQNRPTGGDWGVSFTTKDDVLSRFIIIGESISNAYGSKMYCFEPTDTNPIFNYAPNTEGSWQTGLGYRVSSAVSSIGTDLGHLWTQSADTLSSYTYIQGASGKIGIAVLNNADDSGYSLIVSDEELPTNNYTNMRYLINKAFVDAGLVKGGKVNWSLGPSTFDTNLTNGNCKYLSLYALVSSDGKWVMPIIITSSVALSSVTASVGEYSSTVDRASVTVTLSESGNASMFRDQRYLPAGLALQVNAGFEQSPNAGNWWGIPVPSWSYQTGYSTGESWTVTYDMNRSGDAGSQSQGNVWEAGTFVGATLVNLFTNKDVTDWSSATPDPAYERIDESLYDETFEIKGYIVLNEDIVKSIMNDELSVTELSELVNSVPVDDTTSLIDGTTSVGDIETDINTNNGSNGSLVPVQVPRKTITDTGIGFFSTLYDVNALQLMNIADAVSSAGWLNDAFTKLTGNPVEGIFSLMAVPFAPPANSGNNDVVQCYKRPFTYNNGSNLVTVHGNVITNFKAEVDMGSVDISNWPLTSSFRDYSPYTKAKIYLPFVGEIDLDLSLILSDNYDNATLSLVYTVELYTGTATIELKLTNDTLTDKTILQTTAVVGMMLPVSGGSFGSILGSIIGVVGGVAGGAIGMAAGGPIGGAIGAGVGRAVSGVGNALGTSNVSRSSSASANAGFTSNLAPYITITQYNPVEVYDTAGYEKSVGKPTYTLSRLKALDSGTYVKVLSSKLNGINATAEEKETLAQILENGFWT